MKDQQQTSDDNGIAYDAASMTPPIGTAIGGPADGTHASASAPEARPAVEDLIAWHRKDAENPDWAAFDQPGKHVHDWRTYITPAVRAAWESIPLVGRCAVIHCCQDMAETEHWD